MADLNGDGNDDLITGCFEGGIYWLRLRHAGGEFDPPRPVLDKLGAPIRVGQYWDYQRGKWVHVETTEHREFLGISAHLVDWDDDGDLDFVLGTNEGRAFLRRNEGSAKSPEFATDSESIRAAGADLQVPSRHAMPIAADWDGDGLWDLVTGSGDGSVYWFRNVGERGAPEFAGPDRLVGPASGKWDEPGQRSQVAVTDYDGDGRVDLLVGDYRSRTGTDAAGKRKREYRGWVWLFKRKPAAKPEAGQGAAPAGRR